MRSTFVRLSVLAVGVAVVASCDARLTSTPITVTGGSSSTTTVKGPTATIDTPLVGGLSNVGDSILVVMHLHDDKQLKSATIQGNKLTGSADLGTLQTTIRYPAIQIPVAGSFRTGLKDTVVRRYLKPGAPLDSTLDSLVIQAIVVDSAGVADTVSRRVDLVSGPKVTITAPISGDSTPAGIGLSVQVQADHPDGVARVAIRYQGEASWPTKFDTTIVQTVAGAPRSVAVSALARVPIDAPIHSRVTITATATSVTGRPGNSPSVLVFVRNASSAQPLVTQIVGPRLELTDSVTVSARGDGIRAIGYVARDSVGNTILRDSVLLPQPFAGNVTSSIGLGRLSTSLRGRRIAISGFAIDQSGRTGYVVRSGELSPNGSLVGAFVDSTLLVFGHTFPLPASRNTGLVGDLIWDAPRQRVILSNQDFNRLEIFRTSDNTYDSNGITVGSFPWGLFVANNADQLWVANSGGTNISKVDLVANTEINAARIRTRITPIYQLTEDGSTSTDTASTAKPVFHETLSDAFLYSDRPQYIGQLSNGLLYYSTRPTTIAPKGTIRYLNPAQPFPDAKPIVIFKHTTTNKVHVITNSDSMFTVSGAPASDIVIICDHNTGTNELGACGVSNEGYLAAIDSLRVRVPQTDVSYVTGLDITDAGLTDTTYVAVSGNRQWVGFGSGNTTNNAYIFLASAAGFFSPPISQFDLLNNASDIINGLAMDNSGNTIGAHGSQSYFTSVDVPFHLRLQGKYPNAAAGAGIAMHPLADAGTGDVQRTSYVASGNQTIEILDIFHYVNRGVLPIKTNLYGPLRAALPGAADVANGVVLKLFGVSPNGLVVIDVRASDILPSP